MAFPRTQHQLTVLPDGTVLATGGSRNSDVNDTRERCPRSRVVGSRYRDMAHALQRRRSPALPLVRDPVAGRAGRDRRGWPSAWLRCRGISHRDLLPAVPLQGPSAHDHVCYGSGELRTELLRRDSGRLQDHESRPHSAAVPDPFVQLELRLRTAEVLEDLRRAHGHRPANGNLAPPGMYMLFAINANGVPSVASWVQISAASGFSATARLDAPREVHGTP